MHVLWRLQKLNILPSIPGPPGIQGLRMAGPGPPVNPTLIGRRWAPIRESQKKFRPPADLYASGLFFYFLGKLSKGQASICSGRKRFISSARTAGVKPLRVVSNNECVEVPVAWRVAANLKSKMNLV